MRDQSIHHTGVVGSLSEADLVIEKVPHADTSTIHRLIELGDLARKTLGLLPRAAYFDAAAKGWLLAARYLGQPVGYVLFRLPRDEVVLTHVCVAPGHRHLGIAARLIDEVSARYQERQGIRAKCRDDYNLERAWQGMGFVARGRARGRGRDRASMTVWWRDHGHPDLFTVPIDEPTVVDAAIDTNILIDLQLRVEHRQAERSQVLLAPDLSDRIELVVPHGLERDLQRHPDERRDRLIRAAGTYRRPRGDSARADYLFELMTAAIKEQLPRFPKTEQDIGDLWQLAETAAAGVRVFLTWDDRLRHEIAPVINRIELPELAQLRVLDPDHLVIHLDELAHAAAYRPDLLEGSNLTTTRAGSDSETTLMGFLAQSSGESKTELREHLRALARTRQSHSILRDQNDTPVACYATAHTGKILQVPLLRVADHPIAETLARWLLWHLRREARRQRALVVELNDPHLPPLVTRIAGREAYRQLEGRWYAFVVDCVGTGREITEAANLAYRQVGLPPAPLIAPDLAPSAAAIYERAWWPAKITDSALPHFVVPIKPVWSAELFGVPAVLTTRRTELALGREQVYYRSGQPSTLKHPGRIVWYMSKDSRIGPAAFIGTSLLDALDTDTPDQLHAALAQYGVFHLADITQCAATNGLAQALRLSDTELFPTPVTRRMYETLDTPDKRPKAFMGPVNITNDLFAALYTRGTRLPDPE